MGNSAGKEQRPPPQLHAPSGSTNHRSRPSAPHATSSRASDHTHPDHLPSSLHGPRNGGRAEPGGPSNLGELAERDPAQLEMRRQSRQDREARRAERDRITRERERERSLREESVDGGYLVTQGVYTGPEDFNKLIVRQLMIERRIAPFFKGLNEHSDDWRDHQLVAAVRGGPIPSKDDVEIQPTNTTIFEETRLIPPGGDSNNLNIPVTSRSQSYSSESSTNPISSHPTFSLPSPPSPLDAGPGSSPFRPRSKTLASLTGLSKNAQGDMMPQEIHLPNDPTVDGRPIEAVLYEEASECPICFLYYPPYLNKTRCCDQRICSECFVQIKRAEPHAPEHGEPPSAEGAMPESRPDNDTLISEPAGCPFCVQPEFGITYEAPPFRRGLIYAHQSRPHPLAREGSGMSSTSSLPSSMAPLPSPTHPSRRRTTSLSATDASVITTDQIRPDWAQKLASARAHAARRSAAATALHTAAYLMGNGGEGRAFGGFGRRNRRDGAAGLLHPGNIGALAAMVEDHAGPVSRGDTTDTGGEAGNGSQSRPGGRRSRIEDLEDMMMMEAIRLSLASEDDRRRKEEKEAKKEAKKRDKESKKADKASRRSMYGVNNGSGSTVNEGSSSRRPSMQGDSQVVGKGKDVDRSGARVGESVGQSSQTGEASQSGGMELEDSSPRQRMHLLPSDAFQLSTPGGGDGYRPSHLRQMSNTSSSASSMVESGPGSFNNLVPGTGSSFEGSPDSSRLNVAREEAGVSSDSSTAPSTMDPFFNFRSLAAMIGEEDKWESSDTVEHSQGRRESISSEADAAGNTNDATMKKGESSADTREVQGSVSAS